VLSDLSKEKGDPIYEHEIDGMQKIRLPENEYPDCGHATFLLMMASQKVTQAIIS
jgi:hypothetical protein